MRCLRAVWPGERLLSRRVLNDETELLQLIGDVLAISADVLWAVDLNHGGAALLIGLLLSHDQPMAYLTGLAVHPPIYDALERQWRQEGREVPGGEGTAPKEGAGGQAQTCSTAADRTGGAAGTVERSEPIRESGRDELLLAVRRFDLGLLVRQ